MSVTHKLGAGAAVTLTAMLAWGGSAFAVGGGYGPTTPPSGGVPGGFSSIAASEIIGPSGGAVTASVPGGSVIVTVPPGAFASADEVVVTTPDLSQTDTALSALGFSGYQAVAGVGVSVLDGSGSPVAGTFAKSLSVTLTGTSLGVAGERVIQLTDPASASVVNGTLGHDSVSVAISSDPDLVAVNPMASAAVGQPQVPGATVQHTGMPFRGEEDAAFLLVVLGVAALAAAGVRHRRAGAAR